MNFLKGDFWGFILLGASLDDFGSGGLRFIWITSNGVAVKSGRVDVCKREKKREPKRGLKRSSY